MTGWCSAAGAGSGQGNLLSADPLAAVEIAASLLEQHPDPVIRAIGAWLAAYPAELLAELGVENGVVTARRDQLLRQARLSASRLARELGHYRGTAWAARDRYAAANPYPAGNLRATLWLVLKLRDRDISRRQLERILRNRDTRGLEMSGGSGVVG
jgi:hypothetical protein